MRLPVFVGLSLSLGLSACASLAGPHAAPSCDGSAKRPLNRSLWDWEAARPESSPAPSLSKGPETGAMAHAPQLEQLSEVPTSQPVFVSFYDVAKSLRPCTMEVSHG